MNSPKAQGLRAWTLLGVVLCATGLLGCNSQPQVGQRPSPGAAAAPSGATSEPAPADRRAQARLELAAAYFGRGQMSTALEEVKLAIEAKPDLVEAYNLQGLILAAQGQAAAADVSFQRALQLNPADADAMHNRAWFLCQQRRFDEADAQFDRAMALPHYGEAPRSLLAKGVCQARAGRWMDAERSLGKAYEFDPANPVTAFNLAEVLLHRGELERARFYVRRINQIPQQVSAQSLWLAARIERRAGNIESLQDYGRQLRERFPQSPEAMLFERGRFDE